MRNSEYLHAFALSIHRRVLSDRGEGIGGGVCLRLSNDEDLILL